MTAVLRFLPHLPTVVLLQQHFFHFLILPAFGAHKERVEPRDRVDTELDDVSSLLEDFGIPSWNSLPLFPFPFPSVLPHTSRVFDAFHQFFFCIAAPPHFILHFPSLLQISESF